MGAGCFISGFYFPPFLFFLKLTDGGATIESTYDFGFASTTSFLSYYLFGGGGGGASSTISSPSNTNLLSSLLK